MVAFKRNGDGAAPNNTTRNLHVIILSGWLTGRAGSLSHRNLVASLSSSFSSIYKKRFFYVCGESYLVNPESQQYFR